MRIFLLTACIFFAIGSFCSAQEATPEPAPIKLPPPTIRTDLNADDFQSAEQAKKLIAERDAVLKKMHQERAKILQEDAEAKEIHNRIFDLYRKLAILIDSKASMKSLRSELDKVDTKIDGLPRKKSGAEDGKKAVD